MQKALKFIDTKIDAMGMYRVVTSALLMLAAYSLVLAVFGWLTYGALELLVSLVVIVGAGLASNYLLAKLWRVHTNHESALITALIAFFLILPTPLAQLELLFVPALVVIFAMLSKYLIAWKRQHFLNPVAAGVVATMVVYEFFPLPPGYFEPSWWVGQPLLFVPLVLVGATVVHKVRKWTPVLAFLSVGFLFFLFEEWRFFGHLDNWAGFWLSGPSVFLAVFMLTEPFTMPPTKQTQAGYGALVGLLSQTTVFASLFKMTPELALLIGNLALWPFRLQQKLYLALIERRVIAADTYEFVFKKPTGFSFRAGQYLEWMLPHEGSDNRGVRRYFTIASAPTESVVRVALKVPENGSSYKRELMRLDEGEEVIASQLAGDFTLPEDESRKLGFIAGGIGVTPFRSHIQYMVDSGNGRDTVLLYCTNAVDELAYREAFEGAAASLPLQVIPVIAKEEVSSPMEQGYVTEEMLKRRVPDYHDRTWYLSGPPPMVNAYGKLLRKAGVPGRQIKKDFFPGLA
jgi:ferredoxin-NADP reductase/Na+-translocating ferredoxin:NAD+ oxidoreductase RnfD subunit